MFTPLFVHEGVLACNHIKEASNAIEDEKYRVVDEEKALAYGVPAESAQLRAATVGSDEGC
jgi:hypothetical protein